MKNMKKRALKIFKLKIGFNFIFFYINKLM